MSNLYKKSLGLLLGRRLPVTSGTLEVPAVREPVTIRRDAYGIPHIEAAGDEDAWYGLGFCHGQDRSFQLETMQRAVRGTLAELVGRQALANDRLARRIGFYRAAEEQMAALHPEIRLMLESYARGVNDGRAMGCPRPAHEFALLRAQPTPYTAADVLGVTKVMALSLSGNWSTELARLKILTEDGPEALTALDPAPPEWRFVPFSVETPDREAVDCLAEDLRALSGAMVSGGGSNNWALAPSRTATGRPILANDPHLTPSMPSPWYLAHVRTPEWAVAGATMIGGPVFAIGHNGHAAWGDTAGLADNTDLFLEELGPNGMSVREGDDLVPCQNRVEVIRVRGEPPVEEKVLITPRGPIVGPVIRGVAKTLSLRATWLAARPIRGMFQLHRVRSFEAFRSLFAEWPGPMLNLVYADASGRIGWQLVGEVPRRRKGWGTLPQPGWDREAGWEESLLSVDELPHVADPPQGFVATANNQPAENGACSFLGVDWAEDYRLERIVEVLDARTDWDVESVAAFQQDQASLVWREIRDVVLGLSARRKDVAQGLTLLAAWDGVTSGDSPAAALFELFTLEMILRIARSKAPKATDWALENDDFTGFGVRWACSLWRYGHMVRLVREQPEGWFDRSWSEVMADALAVTVQDLRQRYGRDPQRWAWGQIRTLAPDHLLNAHPVLRRIFGLAPAPCGGDLNTVSQACIDPLYPTGNPMIAVSLRAVIDVGAWDKSRFSLPGGQSGNPLSPHYDDLWALWNRGEGVPVAWSEDKIQEATQETLRLVPAR